MIYLRCLRFLREFEKWSGVEKIGKNRGKWGKIAVPESPFIHYSRSTAALRSTGSVDSTGSDFGVTAVFNKLVKVMAPAIRPIKQSSTPDDNAAPARKPVI